MTRTSDLRGQDLIDSRDVIARLGELQDERDTAINSVSEVEEEESDRWTTQDGTELASCWDEEQEQEYQALKGLAEEASGSPDWTYGETLIKDDYFERYAEELADDLGYSKKDVSWPYDCIDWEKAADQLKQDYMSVTFESDEYWIRG